jgi:hypothetical protein
MLLLSVIIALVTVGFVVPCIIDIATTPKYYFDLPSKQTWLVVVVAFWLFGAVAWVLVGRRDVRAQVTWDQMAAGPGGRMPAFGYRPGYGSPSGMRRGRQAMMVGVRFVAPDDNPEFLLELEHRIRGWREGP